MAKRKIKMTYPRDAKTNVIAKGMAQPMAKAKNATDTLSDQLIPILNRFKSSRGTRLR